MEFLTNKTNTFIFADFNLKGKNPVKLEMIDTGLLLDICEISYTEKQLTRLDKLINDFIKEHIIKNFHGIGISREKSYLDLSAELKLKSLKVYFIDTKGEDSFKSCDQNLEPGTKNNDIIKEEFFEESVLEIKDEFDPFANLDTIENSKYIGNTEYEDNNLHKERSNNLEEVEKFKDINDSSFKDYCLNAENKQENPMPKKKRRRKKQAVQTKTKTIFRCKYCKEDFNNKEQLKMHTSQTHDSYPCTLCDYKYASEKLLNKHMLLKHRKRKYTCSACNVSCKTVKLINLHMKQDHGSILEHFCAWCDEKFGSYLYLTKHVHKVHEDDKVHQCEQCDKKFISPSQLDAHIKFVHLKIKPYCCEKCGKSFPTNWFLKHHIETHHTGFVMANWVYFYFALIQGVQNRYARKKTAY